VRRTARDGAPIGWPVEGLLPGGMACRALAVVPGQGQELIALDVTPMRPIQATRMLVPAGERVHATTRRTRRSLDCPSTRPPKATAERNEPRIEAPVEARARDTPADFNGRAKPIFDAWKAVATTVDSSIRHLHNGQVAVMPHNDQGGFAVAMEQSVFAAFVLPLNWNFRPGWHHSYFGPIRIWHDYRDVPEPVIAGNTYYERPDSIIQFVHRQ
jgi:hypothetical protein